jgi:glycosyltransferase involved in cell wall biosynthesis
LYRIAQQRDSAERGSMRIAHFVQRYPPALGGSEDYFARLSRYLAATGDQVTVFTTTAVDLPAFWSTSGRCLRPGRRIEDGVEIRRYHLWHLPYQTRVLKALSFFPYHPWQCLTVSCNPIAWGMWVESGQVSERFDVVHATAFPYGWPLACARRLAKRLGAPFVLTPFLHIGDPDDPHDRTRRAYTSPALLSLAQSADRLFVQTEGERQAFLDRGISAERLILQGMGLDHDSCTGGDGLAARAEWGIGADDVVIGHLANNSREKGSVDLLRAAERAWRQGGRFVLVLAGPEMPNFQTFWRNHRPSGRVIRLEKIDARQKRDFFSAIDVFALPSRSDSFGLVLLEAWANGVPNVGYRAGGIGWVIRDEKDGLLVRCGDIAGLAAAMLRLVGDARLRHSLGAAGRERTLHEFNWTEKFELVRRAYREAFGGRPAGGRRSA